MPSIERTVTVDQPVSAVWRFLSDFTTTEQWDPGTVRTTRRSGDGGVGTIYDNTSKFAGRQSDLVYTVVESTPERRLVLRGVQKSLIATDTITFQGDGATTTVTYHADFEFKGVVKLLGPLLSIPLKKLGDQAEEGMRRELAKL